MVVQSDALVCDCTVVHAVLHASWADNSNSEFMWGGWVVDHGVRMYSNLKFQLN